MEIVHFLLLLASAAFWLASSFISFHIGRAITRNPVLPFKPFTCHPCMSFWICFLMCTVFGWFIAAYFVEFRAIPFIVTARLMFTGAAFLVGLVVHFYVKSNITIIE